MSKDNSIFARFSKIFKKESWYLPFSQTLQDFVVRYAPENKEDKALFLKTKAQLRRIYKAEAAKNLDVEPETFSRFLSEAIYADDIVLPNLVKIGDEKLLSELFFELDRASMLPEIKESIVSKSICPVEVVSAALSSSQPCELRKIAMLKNCLSYTQKMILLEDVLAGDKVLELKKCFSLNVLPTADDLLPLMERLSDNALNKREITTISLVYGPHMLQLTGYTYEPVFEKCVGTTDIVLNDAVLFREDSRRINASETEVVQFGSFSNKEDAISFLKKKFGSLPFTVKSFEVPCQINE